MKSILLKISFCALISALIWTLAPDGTLLKNGLAIFALVGLRWISQAIPIVVTALLVPLLAILSGLLSPTSALSSLSNPIIFLFLGGFALAAALSNQGLDKKLASSVMPMSGGIKLRAIVLIWAVTAFMSMWISNTATTAMMIPVATLPNAVVYVTGDMPQGTMMRCGAWLIAVCILTINLFSHWVDSVIA